jgi:pimeloyl-ACP methyl ester carboxylesterase
MAMLGGIIGKIIRLVGRAATALPREAVLVAAKTWEDNFRKPQGFHWCRNLPELSNPAPPRMSPAELATLQGKNVLLFVHGTISSTSGAFGALASFQDEAARLFAKYGNYAIGFNHHTLTKSVSGNAVDFLSALPPGNYKFDVISHSRGGLLARALKELTPAQLKQLADSNIAIDPGVNIQIDRIVVVGTPNEGTPLANPADLPKAVSRLASVATSFDQDAAEFGLGALFTIFGGIVEGGVAALPGLEDMNPGNPFLKQLNSSSTDISPYYGIAADYLATGGLAAAILDDGFDALFSGVANDLVVPTAGVAKINGAVLPSARLDQYARSAGVFHTDYFRQQETWEKINTFLL